MPSSMRSICGNWALRAWIPPRSVCRRIIPRHLKLYIYGYLNRVQSSRRLEREASRNVEVTCEA
jgi:hypothetical protein